MADSILDVKDILNEYSEDITAAIAQEAQVVARDGVAELKNTSPKRTGKYRKGWRVKTSKGRETIDCTIYNTEYRLTHLLEKPHALRNGGTSKPQVHIAPVEQKCVSTFEKNVEDIIKNGG